MGVSTLRVLGLTLETRWTCAGEGGRNRSMLFVAITPPLLPDAPKQGGFMARVEKAQIWPKMLMIFNRPKNFAPKQGGFMAKGGGGYGYE